MERRYDPRNGKGTLECIAALSVERAWNLLKSEALFLKTRAGGDAVAITTGPGPYRVIPDAELRLIFYMQPMTEYLFYIFPITAYPPPGTNDPRVTALLRRLLYVRLIDAKEFEEFANTIRALMNNRDTIAVGARLIAIMRHTFEQPWAYPALLKTKEIIELRKAFSGVVNATKLPANVTASTPAAFALSFLSRFAGATVAHTSYMAALTNEHYSFFQQKMTDELNLRGVNASLVQ